MPAVSMSFCAATSGREREPVGEPANRSAMRLHPHCVDDRDRAAAIRCLAHRGRQVVVRLEVEGLHTVRTRALQAVGDQVDRQHAARASQLRDTG